MRPVVLFSLFFLLACNSTGTLELIGWESPADDDDVTSDDDDATAADDDDSTVAGPELLVSPEFVDFGGIGIGAVATASIQLVNTGGASVAVSLSIEEPGGAGTFSIAGPDTFSVAGGQELFVPLAFSPPAPTPFEANLVVVHDASNDSPVRVRMFGEGEAIGDDDDAAGDPCCFEGDDSTNQLCFDQTTAACVCQADPWCCDAGWDQLCIDLYVGGTDACPGSGTCGDSDPGGNDG